MSQLKFAAVLLLAAAHMVAAFAFLYHGDAAGAMAQSIGSAFWVGFGLWEECQA